MNVLRQVALTLIIIGAINWGLIGLFNFDLVATIFGGQDSLISRVIYILVGLSGLYALSFYFTNINEVKDNHFDTEKPSYGTEFSNEFDNHLNNKKPNDKNKWK